MRSLIRSMSSRLRARIFTRSSGSYLITATTMDADAVAFDLANTTAPARQLSVVWGDHQTARTGDTLQQPIIVAVDDLHGNAAVGDAVTITASDGGTAAPAAARIRDAGTVSVTWTPDFRTPTRP